VRGEKTRCLSRASYQFRRDEFLAIQARIYCTITKERSGKYAFPHFSHAYGDFSPQVWGICPTSMGKSPHYGGEISNLSSNTSCSTPYDIRGANIPSNKNKITTNTILT